MNIYTSSMATCGQNPIITFSLLTWVPYVSLDVQLACMTDFGVSAYSILQSDHSVSLS